MAAKARAKIAKGGTATGGLVSKPPTPDTCFVIMPFGGWFDQHFEQVYRPAIEDAGLSAKRADDIYRPGTIVSDIWTFTKEASMLLAELTDRNPNVLYELGLAHALAKPVILVTDSIDSVPFDLRALRIIEYDKNDPEWGAVLRAKIAKGIAQVLEAPLEAVLPAFLKVEERSEEGIVTEQERDVLELRREVELLRREMKSFRRPSQARVWGSQAEPLYSSADAVEVEIRRLMEAGLPDFVILDMLEGRTPRGWLVEMVVQIREETAESSAADARR